MKNEGQLQRIRVRVPVTREIDYIVYVENPDNIEEVSAALEKKDPSEWETDPCFYEHLGDAWKNIGSKITRESIDMLEK